MSNVPTLESAALPAALSTVSEEDRLRLENFLVRREACRERVSRMTMEFLQTAQVKTLTDSIESLTQAASGLTAMIFANAKMDPEQYHFNVANGTFVPRQVPGTEQ